jgi:hypothetical protein
MQRLFPLAILCCFLAGANGCTKSGTVSEQDKPSQIKTEVRAEGDEPPSVMFDIKLSSQAGSSPLYDCSYQARGKIARFRLEFKQNGPKAGDIPIAFAGGKFIAVKGSDNSALLEDLKSALDARQIPMNSTRIAELPFDAAILGEKQSRTSTGAYSANPPGDWVLVKLFLPKDGDEGAVYLNLNPILGKGEFSIKDSDYGDYLLKEFAKVL